MNRWLILVCLVACNGNENGLHDVKNGGDSDQDVKEDIDPHEIRASVFYCVAMSSTEWSRYPCWETGAGCESARASALSNGYNTGKCEQFPFAMCHHAASDGFSGWDCRRTKIMCEEARKRNEAHGHEVTPCMRVPPESYKPSSHRLRGPRSWRTARRR